VKPKRARIHDTSVGKCVVVIINRLNWDLGRLLGLRGLWKSDVVICFYNLSNLIILLIPVQTT